MNKPSEADLLGYLLGALDANEQRAVERAISSDDSLRHELEQLEARMASIDFLDQTDERPPIGMARRTSNLVAALRDNELQSAQLQNPELQNPELQTAELQHAEPEDCESEDCESEDRQSEDRESDTCKSAGQVSLSSVNEYAEQRRSWSVVDVMVAAVVCALIAMIFLPAIANSRFQADIRACQNNLRQIGMGLQNYADNYSGRLVPIPVSRELGVAGIYAPRLNDLQLVENENVFFCASQSDDASVERRIPTLEELSNAEGDEVYRLRRQAGGDYAYTLGCYEDGRYRQPEVTNCATTVILGDTPNSAEPGFRSLNHGGRGQNVLLGDFSTKYLMSCMVSPGDNFYQNDQGIVAAGTSPADSVLGGSSASPFVNFMQNQ